MFLGLPGMLFLGAMGVLFLVAVVSGVVLYAPFMRRLGFGTLRSSRSTRVQWLDYHNLLGVVTLAWVAVVGTDRRDQHAGHPDQRGVAGERAGRDDTRLCAGEPVPPARYGSLDTAMAEARRAVPGANPQFIGFPGGDYSSNHHYAIFFQGDTPLTERLLTSVLIDAETGRLTDARPMPWYGKALALSQPLHFGDYGGLPLKILWAIMTLVTIVVLGSGLYLWQGKRRVSTRAHVREVASGGLLEPAE